MFCFIKPNPLDIQLFSTDGLVTLRTISSTSRFDAKNCLIPNVWPQNVKEQGFSCAFYSLSLALKCNGIHIPARKRDIPESIAAGPVVSLRKIGKGAGVTKFGEMFTVDSLEKVLDDERVGFKNYKKIKFSSESAEAFAIEICKQLQSGFNVIIASDIDQKTAMPSKVNGYGAHWALIFGYYTEVVLGKTSYYFLVAQNNRYDIWSAQSLFESNLQIPSKNPYYKSGYYYYKDKSIKKEYLEKVGKLNVMLFNSSYRTIDEKSLDHFRFMGLCIHNPQLADAFLFPQKKKTTPTSVTIRKHFLPQSSITTHFRPSLVSFVIQQASAASLMLSPKKE